MFEQIQGLFSNILAIPGNLKYAPYKAGQPQRMAALALGVVGMAAGYATQGNTKMKAGWKTFLMTFGAVCIAGFVASVINPVTIYSNKKFFGSGLVTGQTDTGALGGSMGRQPSGIQFGAEGFQPAVSLRDPLMPATGMSGGIPVPGVRMEEDGTVGATGRQTGQSDPGYGQPLGITYGAFEPKRPPFYGAPNVLGYDPFAGQGAPPSEGSIYIRDLGEVEFSGGI